MDYIFLSTAMDATWKAVPWEKRNLGGLIFYLVPKISGSFSNVLCFFQGDSEWGLTGFYLLVAKFSLSRPQELLVRLWKVCIRLFQWIQNVTQIMNSGSRVQGPRFCDLQTWSNLGHITFHDLGFGLQCMQIFTTLPTLIPLIIFCTPYWNRMVCGLLSMWYLLLECSSNIEKKNVVNCRYFGKYGWPTSTIFPNSPTTKQEQEALVDTIQVHIHTANFKLITYYSHIDQFIDIAVNCLVTWHFPQRGAGFLKLSWISRFSLKWPTHIWNLELTYISLLSLSESPACCKLFAKSMCYCTLGQLKEERVIYFCCAFAGLENREIQEHHRFWRCKLQHVPTGPGLSLLYNVIVVRLSNFADVSILDWIWGGTLSPVMDGPAMAQPLHMVTDTSRPAINPKPTLLAATVTQ